MKISIITVTFNSEKTLACTFDSVLKQQCDDFEYIVVDGASKDGTVSLIQEYEPKFNGRMKWISEPDKGLYDAMNKGIEMTSGDVVGILNSDDFFTCNDVLEQIAKEFESDPRLDAIYGDIHFVATDATLANPGKCTRYYSSAMFRPWLLRFGFMPAHPSFYVRREVYEKYGLYDLNFRTSSDFEMMVRLFGKNRIKAKYIPMDFVTMRAGGESTAGMEAKKKVNRDIAASLKKHGIFTCQAFQWVRYMWKAFELVYSKLKC
jgi:glycosyltransferase involved in cell wall biosynthesis